MLPEIGQGFRIYMPFWLQVVYAMLLTVVKPDPWPTLPGDICFAGMAFFVWGCTMHLSAGKRIAGGGRERSTQAIRRQELPWCLVVLFLSFFGTVAGYREGYWKVIAWIAAFSIMYVATRLLQPPKPKGTQA